MRSSDTTAEESELAQRFEAWLMFFEGDQNQVCDRDGLLKQQAEACAFYLAFKAAAPSAEQRLGLKVSRATVQEIQDHIITLPK